MAVCCRSFQEATKQCSLTAMQHGLAGTDDAMYPPADSKSSGST